MSSNEQARLVLRAANEAVYRAQRAWAAWTAPEDAEEFAQCLRWALQGYLLALREAGVRLHGGDGFTAFDIAVALVAVERWIGGQSTPAREAA